MAELRERCQARGGGAGEALIANDLSGLAQADLILSVCSAGDALIEPEHLKPGALV